MFGFTPRIFTRKVCSPDEKNALFCKTLLSTFARDLGKKSLKNTARQKYQQGSRYHTIINCFGLGLQYLLLDSIIFQIYSHLCFPQKRWMHHRYLLSSFTCRSELPVCNVNGTEFQIQGLTSHDIVWILSASIKLSFVIGC